MKESTASIEIPNQGESIKEMESNDKPSINPESKTPEKEESKIKEPSKQGNNSQEASPIDPEKPEPQTDNQKNDSNIERVVAFVAKAVKMLFQDNKDTKKDGAGNTDNQDTEKDGAGNTDNQEKKIKGFLDAVLKVADKFLHKEEKKQGPEGDKEGEENKQGPEGEKKDGKEEKIDKQTKGKLNEVADTLQHNKDNTQEPTSQSTGGKGPSLGTSGKQGR